MFTACEFFTILIDKFVTLRQNKLSIILHIKFALSLDIERTTEIIYYTAATFSIKLFRGFHKFSTYIIKSSLIKLVLKTNIAQIKTIYLKHQ